jgi:hypothetical protein
MGSGGQHEAGRKRPHDAPAQAARLARGGCHMHRMKDRHELDAMELVRGAALIPPVSAALARCPPRSVVG